MLDAGLGFSLVRLVASASEKRGTSGLSSVASVAFFSFAAIGVAVLTGGLLISPHIPAWFHISGRESASVIQAYRLAAIAGAAGLPLGTFNGILVGLQRTPLSGVLRAGGALFGALLALVLLECRFGIAALAVSNLGTSLFLGVFALLFLRKLRPGFRIRFHLVNKIELLNLWRVAGYLQLVRIAYIIALNTDPLIIAVILGASEVTPYVITMRMAILFSVVLADKAPSAVYPAMAQMYARGEHQAVRRSFLTLVYYSTRLAGTGAILVACLNAAFVTCWVGPQSYGGGVLNGVFVYWVLLDTILRGSSLIPLVTGDMKTWAFASIAEAAVNVAASFLLVHSFGLAGVAAGTAVARTFITGLVIPFWSCKKLGLKFSTFFCSGILSPLLRTLPAAALTVFVAFALPLSMGWYRLGAVGSVALIANLAVFEGPKWFKTRTFSLKTLIGDVLRPELKPLLSSDAIE
jgi:O-antigen/teichoic acid export membrane protein